MDRRVVIAVVLVAIAAALGMALLVAPSAELVTQPAELAAPLSAPDGRHAPRSRGDGVASDEPANPTRPAADVETRADELGPGGADPDVPETTGAPRHRCLALGVQAGIVDDLVVLGSNGDLDEEERALMLSRISEIALKIVDETEALRGSNLSCGETARVDLHGAADFLAEAYPDLELDETHAAQITRAVAALDSMEWAEVD